MATAAFWITIIDSRSKYSHVKVELLIAYACTNKILMIKRSFFAEISVDVLTLQAFISEVKLRQSSSDLSKIASCCQAGKFFANRAKRTISCMVFQTFSRRFFFSLALKQCNKTATTYKLFSGPKKREKRCFDHFSCKAENYFNGVRKKYKFPTREKTVGKLWISLSREKHWYENCGKTFAPFFPKEIWIFLAIDSSR